MAIREKLDLELLTPIQSGGIGSPKFGQINFKGLFITSVSESVIVSIDAWNGSETHFQALSAAGVNLSE